MVIVGMAYDDIIEKPAIAQKDENQTVTFDTIKCKTIICEDSVVTSKITYPTGGFFGGLKIGSLLNEKVVWITDFDGYGNLLTFSKEGKLLAGLGATTSGNGMLSTYSKEGKELVELSGNEGGGAIITYNFRGVRTGVFGTDKNKDGIIGLFDRYGDVGWGMSGKR